MMMNNIDNIKKNNLSFPKYILQHFNIDVSIEYTQKQNYSEKSGSDIMVEADWFSGLFVSVLAFT